jgi:hypothetical protein
MAFLGFLGLMLLVLLVLCLPAVALFDANRRPEWAWTAAGESRSKYVGLMACSYVVFIPILSLAGVCMSGVYWCSMRKRVRAAEAAGPSAAPAQYAAVAPGWYPDPAEPGWLRWWNGVTWTEQRSAAPHATPAPQSPPAPQTAPVAATSSARRFVL